MQINVYPVSEEFGGDYMKFCVRKSENNLPDWYKMSQSYVGEKEDKTFLHKRMSIKKCMPVFDFLSYGLDLHLPFTIFGEGDYPERKVYSNAKDSPYCQLSSHPQEQAQLLPVPQDYESQPYKIDFPYMIESPRGYSAIYVQPMSEFSKNALFIPGLVNTDNYKNQVNFPFLLKKSFKGQIPAGEQFMKVFFFKRENLEVFYKEYEEGSSKIKQARTQVVNWGRYFYKSTRFGSQR